MMVHTGEKKIACPYCTYRCNLDSNLRKHCIAKHNMEHPPKRKPVLRLEYLSQEQENTETSNTKKTTSASKNSKRKFSPMPNNILGKHQKIELMLPESEDGSVDTASIIKFLEKQGFYGQQSLQVEVGDNSFIVNCKKKTATDNVNTVDMDVSSCNNFNVSDLADSGQPLITESSLNNSASLFKLSDFSVMPIKTELGVEGSNQGTETSSITVDSHQNSSVTEVTLSPSQLTTAMDITPTNTVTDSDQLSATGEIDHIDGECILTDEALRHITLLGGEPGSDGVNNPVIVIQQPDGTLQVQPQNVLNSSSLIDLGKADNLQFELATGTKTGDGGTLVPGLVEGEPPTEVSFHIDSPRFTLSGTSITNSEDEFIPHHSHQMLVVSQSQL